MTTTNNTDTWTNNVNSLTVTRLDANSFLVCNDLGRSTVDSLQGWRNRAAQLLKLGWHRVPAVSF